MRRRITDLFKTLFAPIKHLRNKVLKRKYEGVEVKEFTPERKKPPSRWVLAHNQIQAKTANSVRRRRKKNKVARKSRQINRKAA